jgi:hypothetical protein
MWKSVLSISKVFGKAVGRFPVGFSMVRHFLGPQPPPSCYAVSRSFSNSLLLACCMRRAASVSLSALALQGIDAEPLAQVLCRFIQ